MSRKLYYERMEAAMGCADEVISAMGLRIKALEKNERAHRRAYTAVVAHERELLVERDQLYNMLTRVLNCSAFFLEDQEESDNKTINEARALIMKIRSTKSPSWNPQGESSESKDIENPE